MSIRALLPLIGRADWWDWDYPSRIMDQCFALHLCDDDLLPPRYIRGFLLRPRTRANIDSSGQSEVNNDDKEFNVSLNVSQFQPEELQVKVVGECVLIQGKHDEKSDEHGFVSREFTRQYVLPKACEREDVAAYLSPEGVLTITVPKKALEAPPNEERQVPITQTQQSKEAVEVPK